MSFFFLKADAANEVSISDFAVTRNVRAGDGKHSASAGDALVDGARFADAMWEEAAELIGCAACRNVGVVSFKQSSE